MNSNLLLLALLALSSSAFSQTLVLEQLADLPSILDESSGIVHHGDHTFWSHNDSGNAPQLYRVDTLGQHLQTLTVNASNVDWEELTKDVAGNIYIADFGNNANARTDLRVYRLSADLVDETAPVDVDTIFFNYGDQLAFPPADADRHFDMEAMVWLNDTLHLFSKDRSSPHAGITRHYKLPATPGTYTIFPQATFNTGQGNSILSVTGAALSDDGQRLVLINANSIWLFADFSGSDFFSGTVEHLMLGNLSQKEAICFVGDMLYITDEKSPLSDGHLYRVNPSLFVGVGEMGEGFGLRAGYAVDGQFDAIHFESEGLRTWTLYATDGRLLANGSIAPDQRSIARQSFRALPAGHAVIHVTDRIGNCAAMLVSIR